MPTRTFWLEPTSEVAWGLRRYSPGPDEGPSSCATGYHSALVYLERRPATFDELIPSDGQAFRTLRMAPEADQADPRWPQACSLCEYRFTSENAWQPWQELIYRRTDTGAEHVLHQNASAESIGVPVAPPGASWDAWWMGDWSRGADGIALMVRLPDGHDWAVDGEAANCTRKGDRTHQCWIRHGDPRECRVTVDKNGDTCQAGGGSIASDGFHGFLRNGVLG